VLLRFIIFQRFFILHFHVFSVIRCHHFYNELANFAFFVFVRHTTHCFLLLVCYIFCGWKRCPEEAHLNRWAKRWLIIKYNHQKSLFISLSVCLVLTTPFRKFPVRHMKCSCVCTIENHNDYKITYDITMLNQDSFGKFMHMAASVRETRAVHKSLHSTIHWILE